MTDPRADGVTPVEGSEPITFQTIKHLRVRGDELFWKGRRVHTRLTLDPADRLIAWVVAITTILAAVATIVASLSSLRSGPSEIILSGQKQPLNVSITNTQTPQVAQPSSSNLTNAQEPCDCDIGS